MIKAEITRSKELGNDHCHTQLPLLLSLGSNLKYSSVLRKGLSLAEHFIGAVWVQVWWAKNMFLSGIKDIMQQ